MQVALLFKDNKEHKLYEVNWNNHLWYFVTTDMESLNTIKYSLFRSLFSSKQRVWLD